MIKIQRVVESTCVTLTVSGRIDAEQLPELRRLVRDEGAGNVALELTEVTLVDAAVVRFLVRCEAHGVRLANCPAYIREWMNRERETRE